MDNTEDLISALQTVRKTFETLGIRCYIGGSVASSCYRHSGVSAASIF
jgi:hypothetical protein